MPELPEVEIVRRGLELVLAGQLFARVTQRRADLRYPLPERFAERLEGRRVAGLERRGKYLLARLSDRNVLVIHLGMTGRFTVNEGAKEVLDGTVRDRGSNPKHDHLVFVTGSGAAITYNDPRRFGFMLLMPEAEIHSHYLTGLGPEPLGDSFDAAYLASRARDRATDLKTFLLDQRVIAGLGNIYVSEALHRAGLSPNRRAASLARLNGKPAERARRLVPAIRSVLEDAIAAGGSTLRDYRQADGAKGGFQNLFSVYAREGEPCARQGCRGIVRRGINGGRSTFFCGACQR